MVGVILTALVSSLFFFGSVYLDGSSAYKQNYLSGTAFLKTSSGTSSIFETEDEDD